MNKKNNSSSKIFYYILIGFLIMMIIFAFTSPGSSGEKLTYNQVVSEYFQKDKVEEWYVVGNSKIVFRFSDDISKVKDEEFPKKADAYIIYSSKEYDYLFEQYQTSYLGYEPPSGSAWDIIYPLVMVTLAIVFIVMLFKMFSSKGNGTMGFGKSRARAVANIKVRFNDIAGAEEEKEELKEIVDFLKNPQKFTQLGARIPKGVLLVGPPGTGKTLLARAVAGESEVPFLSISGSDFVEMFVGVGASRVRDLFDQAKKNSPCIIFIDEIDAVGRQRGAGLGGSNDEREQTLNQLLVELDGFEANQGIIVLAATNRVDVLDPALLRPGRFDRQVYVHEPDVKGREGIIKIHAKNKPLAEDIDFNVLARITSGFTGADIENMLNEAAILAARANRPRIIMEDITEGINKAMMGPQKKSLLITENDKRLTAYHEAGHAIVHKKLEYGDDVQEVSIIPRGMAGGYTASLPINDDRNLTFNKLNDILACFMGGRVAELVGLGEIQAGCSNDIERATNIARKMVTEWGMSDKFGFMGFGGESQVFIGRDYQNKTIYSEKVAGEIDEEIKRILDQNYARAMKIIKENKKLLDQFAELLMVRETIYKEEIDMLMEGKTNQEIIEHMEAKEQIRKGREAKEREEMKKLEQMKEIDAKVKTSEIFLKHGIITEEDHKKVVQMRDEFKQKQAEEQAKEDKKQTEKDVTEEDKKGDKNE